jgi:hypothetical protein
MKLSELAPGDRFRLPLCGKVGTLLSHGVMGDRVTYSGAQRDVSFEVKSGDEVVGAVAFTAPGKPEIISSGSEVERI